MEGIELPAERVRRKRGRPRKVAGDMAGAGYDAARKGERLKRLMRLYERWKFKRCLMR